MLIIGMASFFQGFTNKQKKGTSLDWYFILTLWTIAIDIYWNSFSITHTAWIFTCDGQCGYHGTLPISALLTYTCGNPCQTKERHGYYR